MPSFDQNDLGRSTKEGESPVRIGVMDSSGIQSTARHVKPCRNARRPLRKAKYSLVTDSEPVPWGKGEKNPGRGVKRIWNCMLTKSQRTLMSDDVPIEEWAGELWTHARLSRRSGAEAKASLKRATVCVCRPETRRSSHDQVEVRVKPYGGPNRRSLKRPRMNCGSWWNSNRVG